MLYEQRLIKVKVTTIVALTFGTKTIDTYCIVKVNWRRKLVKDLVSA